MVNYVPKLMQVMHNFNADGQKLLLNVIRENRAVVNKRYGFARELPSIMFKDGSLEKLYDYSLNKQKFWGLFDDLLVSGLKANPKSKYWIKSAQKLYDAQAKVGSKNLSLIEDLSIDFESKKQAVIEIFKQRGFKGQVLEMKAAKTPEELSGLLVEGQELLYSDMRSKLRKMLKQSTVLNNRNGYPLEYLQEVRKLRGEVGETILELQKTISPQSANPEIVKIEEFLKTQFGIEYVHFGTLEEAQHTLDAVKIASREGIPLPKAILTSNLMRAEHGGFNEIGTDFRNIVFLKPERDVELFKEGLDDAVKQIKNKKLKKYLKLSGEINSQLGVSNSTMNSTQSPLHVPLHELVHSEVVGQHFENKMTKQLSDGQKKIATGVSSYSALSVNGRTEEIRTELRVKQILSKYQSEYAQPLTPDEERLLDFLT